MPTLVVTVAVEGPTDVPVARRILESVGLEMGPIYEMGGKAGLDKRLNGYNRAAAFSPWLVLRDLDHDAPCAAALVANLLPRRSDKMAFRVAVREIEAWLLADGDRIASYLVVPRSRVPDSPDRLSHAKRALVDLARRSRKRAIRDDIVPEQGVRAQVGPGYLGRISEYAAVHWRPHVAAHSSPSLRRCLTALKGVRG